MSAAYVAAESMIHMLTPDLERRLGKAAQTLARAQQQRDATIREAAQAGGGLREIARAVGLSHAGVKKIVERG